MRLVTGVMLAAALIGTAACAHAQNASFIPTLERLAGAGNAEAIFHIGMAYQTGSGVAEDHAKAVAAFRRAAALGDPLASYKLGCYYAGQDPDQVARDDAQALRYKLVAAKAGYALAQQDVGGLYAQNGDMATGLKWLKASADQGWSGGLMTLASVYNGAKGVDPDAAKTAAYFQLFLERATPDVQQIAWLDDFEKRLSANDRKRADDLVKAFRPAPTPLTLKALSGQRAAQTLVERAAAR